MTLNLSQVSDTLMNREYCGIGPADRGGTADYGVRKVRAFGKQLFRDQGATLKATIRIVFILFNIHFWDGLIGFLECAIQGRFRISRVSFYSSLRNDNIVTLNGCT